jgi:hypothetical protein
MRSRIALRHVRRASLLVPLAAAAGVLGYAASSRSADHFDSPAVVAAPAADIADVFAWMDGPRVVLAMTVYPAAPQGAHFDPRVQYVLHTASGAGLGKTAAPVDVIATFDDAQAISLWVGGAEHVTGDASAAAGLSSADGKVKVFAGMRADPFFFNLDGFKEAVADIETAAPTLAFDEAGCPAVDPTTQAVIVNQLAGAPDGGAPADYFAKLNTLALVVSLDKSLVTAGGTTVSVWGATYRSP